VLMGFEQRWLGCGVDIIRRRSAGAIEFMDRSCIRAQKL